MNRSQEAMKSINDIMVTNEQLKVANEKLQERVKLLEGYIIEKDRQLKDLKPFEGLLKNAPDSWVFEISDKILITSIVKNAISVKGRWANITTAQNEGLKKKATDLINEVIEASIRDTFFNGVRFRDMASRQKLFPGLDDEEGG